MVKNGKESIELYKEIFGAKELVHMPFQKEMGTRMGLPDDFDYENSTMHAELEIGGAKVMLSDNAMNKNPSGNVQIFVDLDSKKELDEIYERIKKKKFQIIMDPVKTFWGAWITMFEDSNGIGWQVAYGERGSATPS